MFGFKSYLANVLKVLHYFDNDWIVLLNNSIQLQKHLLCSSLYLISLNGVRPLAAYHYFLGLLKEMPILALKSTVCVFIFILKQLMTKQIFEVLWCQNWQINWWFMYLNTYVLCMYILRPVWIWVQQWWGEIPFWVSNSAFMCQPKLYITSTLNIDLILWHTQLIVCAIKC